MLLWAHSVMCMHEFDLDYLMHYASSLPEHLQQTTPSPQQTMRTFIHRIATALGFKIGSYFSVHDFEKIIKEVIERRSTQYMQGRLVEKIVLPVDARLIIWGELNGAFHSLVRDVSELYKQGRITQELVLADNCYFLFNGNVIGDGPYALEVFMLVVYLMYKNPQRVIYIKGDQEDKEHWIRSSFEQQIQKFNRALGSQNNDVYSNQLRIFFNSLPLALYAFAPEHVKQDIKKAVRFSYYPPDYDELDEASFAYFFDAYTPSVISLLDKTNASHTAAYQIVAYLYCEPNKDEYAPSQGLLLKSKKEDTVYWTVISSPMLKFREQDQFFNDAFAVMTTAYDLNAWTVALHYQDTRTLKGFKVDESRYLLTGDLISDQMQEKVKQLERKLHDLDLIKQQLRNDCLSDVSIQQPDENILSFIKRRNWRNLWWMGEMLPCC